MLVTVGYSLLVYFVLDVLVLHVVLQWTLRITDTLVHRLLSFIRGMSFIGVFYFSHPHFI